MLNLKQYKKYVEADEKLYASTKNLSYPLSLKDKFSPEIRIVRWYRLSMVNRGNSFGKFISFLVLKKLSYKYGVSLSRNTMIGAGFVVGHWGRVIINANSVIGEDFVVSNNVIIGMDMRGKRKGVPTIGNRVCIHGNSTIVGNIRIGNDVLIAPNTLVNFDVPDHSVVIGNPAVIHPRENATEGFIGYHT